VPAGFGNALKFETTNLPAGTLLTCLGVSDSVGDGVPIVKWADPEGKPFGLDAEFEPSIGDCSSSVLMRVFWRDLTDSRRRVYCPQNVRGNRLFAVNQRKVRFLIPAYASYPDRQRQMILLRLCEVR